MGHHKVSLCKVLIERRRGCSTWFLGHDLAVVHISSTHISLLRIKCMVPFIDKGTFSLDDHVCSWDFRVLLLKNERQSRCWETTEILILICSCGHPNIFLHSYSCSWNTLTLPCMWPLKVTHQSLYQFKAQYLQMMHSLFYHDKVGLLWSS